MSATAVSRSAAFAPKQRFSERAVVLLLLLGSSFYMLAFRRVVNMEPDEGIVLQGAQRILNGQIPYRDFFTFYTPGSFYFTALLLKVFGDSIITARSALVAFGAVFPAITYVLARRTCARSISLTIAILVAVDTAPYRFLVLHNWDSTFWTCLAAYCAVRWLESKSSSFYACATGTLASLTFLTEQSKGAGLFLGILIAITVLRISGIKVRALGAFLAGGLLPLAVALAYFGIEHALRVTLSDWLWPLQHYSQANHVPYGHQNWSDASRNVIFHTGPIAIRVIKAIAVSPGFIIPVLPLVALALLMYWTVQLRRRNDSYSEHFVLLTAIISGLLLSVVTVRADILHFVYLSPLVYLVLAWILGSENFWGSMLSRILPYLMVYVLVAFGFMGLALLANAVGARNEVQTRRGLIRTREPDSLLQYALANTQPNEKVLVYPYLPIYYYLTATQSPSRYDYFQPGMNTRQQAQEILQSLRASSVSTVLLEPDFLDKVPNSWPGTPVSAVAEAPVADYIARNYKICRALHSAGGWRFLYLRQVNIRCP